MIYKPNRTRARVGLVVATAVLLAGAAAFHFFRDFLLVRWLFVLCFGVWVLVTGIVFGHAASTFRMDSEYLNHRLFGLWTRQVPASEIASFRTELGLWPGIFKLADGSEIHVSGIAVGTSDRLREYLARNHPHIEYLDDR